MYDNLFKSANSLSGWKVIIHRPVPKMQLSKDCPVTSEFRKEINQWMIEFFGYTEDDIIDKDKVIMLHASRELIMSVKVWQELYSHLSISEKFFDWNTAKLPHMDIHSAYDNT